MRTGQRLYGDAAARFVERKFNPNHDPEDGRFTFGPGGRSLPPRSISVQPARMASPRNPNPLKQTAKPKPTPAPPIWARTHPGEQLPVWNRLEPIKEPAPVVDWRAEGSIKRLEIEQRAENARQQFYYNWGRGMTREEAAAWAANSEIESRSDPNANQDGGAPGRALFQWERPGRADVFDEMIGVSIETSTRDQQHRFREWELRHEFRRAKRLIDEAVGAGEKARAISLHYLKPASKEVTANDRANLAEAIMRRLGPR